jgi:hypothetical protein
VPPDGVVRSHESALPYLALMNSKTAGLLQIIVVAIALVAAFIVQPVSEWGFFGTILAIGVAALGVSGALAFRGGGAQRSPSRRLAIIGLIAVVVVLISEIAGILAGTTYGAEEVLFAGLWIALAFGFIPAVTRRDSAPVA